MSARAIRCGVAAATVAAALKSPVAVAGTSDNGLTLKVYSNTGLYGEPVSTSVQQSASVSLPGAAHGGAWSAELTGSLTFPGGFDAGGVYSFDCDFFNTTLGFVWVDGHLVCQDGNAYQNQASDTDNPLPVNLFKDSLLGARETLPFRAHLYYNQPVSYTHLTLPTIYSV